MSEQQNGGRRDKLRRAGDVISFVLGWGLIWWQALFVPPQEVNETFLLIAASLVGAPLAGEALARIRGGAGGSPSSSSPAGPGSPPSPSSSSATSPGGEP